MVRKPEFSGGLVRVEDVGVLEELVLVAGAHRGRRGRAPTRRRGTGSRCRRTGSCPPCTRSSTVVFMLSWNALHDGHWKSAYSCTSTGADLRRLRSRSRSGRALRFGLTTFVFSLFDRVDCTTTPTTSATTITPMTIHHCFAPDVPPATSGCFGPGWTGRFAALLPEPSGGHPSVEGQSRARTEGDEQRQAERTPGHGPSPARTWRRRPRSLHHRRRSSRSRSRGHAPTPSRSSR